MWDTAHLSRETARFEARLMMMEAEQKITDGIFLVSQYNDLAQSSDPEISVGAQRDLRFAIYRLDALIVGIDSWSRKDEDLNENWAPYFDNLCRKLREQAFLVRNESGMSLEGAQNACGG